MNLYINIFFKAGTYLLCHFLDHMHLNYCWYKSITLCSSKATHFATHLVRKLLNGKNVLQKEIINTTAQAVFNHILYINI